MCVDVLGCQAAPMSEWRPRTPASPCCRLAHLARFWHGQRSRTTGRSRLDSWFGGLGDRLVAVDVEARVAYVAREDVDALEATHPSEAVRFLPGHDQWVMGPGTKDAQRHCVDAASPHDAQGQPSDRRRCCARNMGSNGDEVTVTWLDERRRPRKAIERETARLAAILDRDLRLTLAS